MNEDRQSLVHLHSNEIINGDGKIPTSGSVEYGEIAIGYADGYERMYIRNDSDEIVSFSSDDKFNESFRVMSKAMCDLDDRVLALEEMSALTVGDLIETTTELENISSSGKTVDAIIIKGINNRLTGAETSAGTFNSAVNTLEASATSANTRITTLESSASSVNNRLDTLESSASSVNTRLDNLDSSATSANTRITTLESSATSVNTRLDNLDSSATSANTRVTTLEASATSVNTRLDGLETSAGTFNTRISDLEASAITVNDVIYDENTFKNVSTSGKVVDAMVIKDAINEISPMVETTWSALKSMRDGGTLTPGMWYRITDYVATTIDTESRSANHPFDILVMANDTSHLCEHGFACLHSGDTYFTNTNFSKWKVSYCLDNDTNRFAWADTTNGKGVVYRLVDEWENDVPYDFKGIQFKRYKVTRKTEYQDYLPSALDGLYIGLSGTQSYAFDIDSSDYKWYYTFSRIGETFNDDIIDDSILGTGTGLVKYERTAYDNEANYLNNNVHANGVALYNLIMSLDNEYSGNTEEVADNLEFKMNGNNNTFFGPCSNSFTLSQFRMNIIFGIFRHYEVATDFQTNVIVTTKDNCFNSFSSIYFENNILYLKEFSMNKIGGNCRRNIFYGGQLRSWTITSSNFVDNIIEATTRADYNNISGIFKNNLISASTFNNNCINAQTQYNNFFGNLLGVELVGYLEYTTIPSNVNNFSNVTICGSIRGSSQSQITLGASQFYSAVTGMKRHITIEAQTDGSIIATWKENDVDMGVKTTDNGTTWTSVNVIGDIQSILQTINGN